MVLETLLSLTRPSIGPIPVVIANPYPLALPPGDSSRRLEVEDPRPRPPAARPVGLLRVCSVARHRRIVCRASPPRQRLRDTFDALRPFSSDLRVATSRTTDRRPTWCFLFLKRIVKHCGTSPHTRGRSGRIVRLAARARRGLVLICNATARIGRKRRSGMKYVFAVY